MERLKKYLKFLLILLPAILVFKNLFDISNPLVWGDAPYFYTENLKELFNIPFAWEIRNNNFGASQLLTLWLFIPTFLLGLLHFLFGLNHEISIRVIFYLPFLIFGGLGIWLLLSKYKFSNLAKIFGTILYLLNTYSISLFDGGQIGVLLSYGLFPFCFYSLMSFYEKKSFLNFISAVIFHFLIVNNDLRIALILILFEMTWLSFFAIKKNLKSALNILLIYFFVLILSSFWLIPFAYGVNSETSSSSNTQTNFINLTNSFYLFQPHFPENDFGNLNKTPIYFIFLPLILLLGLLKKDKLSIKLGILFLIFAFLSKGASPPLGNVYSLIVSLPLGNAFRDSSKFYIPTLLVSSFLIANTIDYLSSSLRKSNQIWIGLIYVLLLITILPALLGQLTGILGNPPNKFEFNEIRNLIKETGNFRSLWFNEKPSLGFADWNHPPVSASSLVNERPFASMTDSDYDLFGFLHDKNISEWYELLGIKNIFYPPYEREKSLSKQEEKERKIFESFISQIPGLANLNMPISFPAYQTKNPLPKIFTQEKIFFALGGDDIYEKLFENENFTLENNALIFPESCKSDPQVILNLNTETFNLLLTEDKNDLYLSFFCNSFKPVTESKLKEWAINDSSKYLNWKSQLIERGIKNKDYDFNKGLAYSTKENEKLEYILEISETQNYYLGVRFLTATQSAGLKIDFLNEEKIFKSKDPQKLQWEMLGPLNLEKGRSSITLTNLGGLMAFNTLGLIPEKEFNQRKAEIDQKLAEMIPISSQNPEISPSTVSFPDFRIINPSEYEIKLTTPSNWLVFSERFNKDWILKSGDKEIEPLPFYSMINGYYIKDLDPNQTLKLYYKPQDYVNRGLALTLIGLLALSFAIIVYIIRRNGYFKKLLSNSKN